MNKRTHTWILIDKNDMSTVKTFKVAEQMLDLFFNSHGDLKNLNDFIVIHRERHVALLAYEMEPFLKMDWLTQRSKLRMILSNTATL